MEQSTTDRPKFDKKRSLEVARRRHLMIKQRCSTHLCRKKNLEDIFADLPDKLPNKKQPGKFINIRYKVMSRTLASMVKRREILLPGTVPGELGSPPQNTYCCYRVHPLWLFHDTLFTDYWQALGWPEGVVRGKHVEKLTAELDGKNVEVWPDAERDFNTKNGITKRFYEMDCGTEGFDEIEKKVAAYKKRGCGVIFLTTTPTRRNKLMKWTEALGDKVLFGLWSEVVANPRGKVWALLTGEMISIET